MLLKYFRRLLVFGLLAASIPPALSYATDADPLTSLIAEALANNPEVHASQARWALFESRIAQAGALEDPMLMLRIDNGLLRDPLNFSRDSATAKVIGLSQAVPFYGKRELRRQSAELDVQRSHLETEERKLSLRRMVSETWYRLFLTKRSLELLDGSIASLDDLNRFAETLYAVGQGGQQDVLLGQVRRSKMEDERLELLRQRRSLAATLNILVYREADSELPPMSELRMQPVTQTLTELEALADVHLPQLQAPVVLEAKAEVGRKLAEKEFFPDVTVALEYMQRDPSEMDKDGYDMYSAGLTFNLPVYKERRRAMLAEAEAEGRMARQERAMIQNQIRLTLTDALARLERLEKTAELYRDGLIPQAEQSLEAALAAYRAGRAEYMTVLDSQMSLFEYNRDYFEAITEHQMQRALIEEAVGTVLSDVTTDKEQP